MNPLFFPQGRELHHVIVHIPIILLLVAPILVVVSLFLPSTSRDLSLGAALALMVSGTLATFAAAVTGEAAMNSVGATPAFQAALEQHRALAQSTVELFSALTLGFAALYFAPRLLRSKLDPYLSTSLLAIYLVFYATGSLLLVHTALEGGNLVRALGSSTTASCHITGKEIVR
jgi:uncharacterized membrane protein